MSAEAAERRLDDALKAQLISLGYNAYLEVVRQALEALGYEDVRVLSAPGIGGVDLEARFGSGVTNSRILVQAKRYERPVQRRFVDELRGAVIRLGAGQGMVITTSSFSVAARTAAAGDPIAPVRLVEGEEFTRLLARLRIGVRKSTLGRPRVDGWYFARVRRRHPGHGRRGVARAKSAALFWE